MRRALRTVSLTLALALAIASPLAAPAADASTGRFQTGLDMYPPDGPESMIALARVHALGAKFLRLVVSWRVAAPRVPPSGFDPSNQAERAYRWSELDHLIQGAVANGLEPIVDISDPPSWGESPQGAGLQHPDPAQLALFAHAAATRYDGSHGLPWVRYWEVWNEPNVSFFLEPQFAGGRAASVDTYRAILNGFYAAVHGARTDDVVIGGELFPNQVKRPGVTSIAPLDFTRRLFCLSAGPHPRRVCSAQADADVWSVHPYTSGGPSTMPANRENIWIRNLQSFSSLVWLGQRLGGLVSAHAAQAWVTEFSWDSNPPDPLGVPVRLEQRWVAEALYRGWSAGIGVFTWFSLRDLPVGQSLFQSGLYFACPAGDYCDTPKPAASSFRFPFVAYSRPKRRALVWGRTPAGARGKVAVQWRSAGRWQTLQVLKTDGDGVFYAHIKLPPKAFPRSAVLRALQLGGGASPSFGLYHPPDVLVTPFGS